VKVVVKVSSGAVFEDNAEMIPCLESLVHFDDKWMGDVRQELSFKEDGVELVLVQLGCFGDHFEGTEIFGEISFSKHHLRAGTLTDFLDESVVLNLVLR
jgi:hypothetical protein